MSATETETQGITGHVKYHLHKIYVEWSWENGIPGNRERDLSGKKDHSKCIVSLFWNSLRMWKEGFPLKSLYSSLFCNDKNNTFNDLQPLQSIVPFHCQKSDNWSYQTEKDYVMWLLEALGQTAIPYSFRFSLILFTYSSKIGISVSLLTVSWGHSQLPESSLLPCAVPSFVIKTTRENYFSPILGKSPFFFPQCFSKLCSLFSSPQCEVGLPQ